MVCMSLSCERVDQADSVDMEGYLEGCDGAKIYPPTTDEKQDIISIGTLLQVMQNVEDKTAGNCGLSLDEPSSVATSHANVRSDGLIMILLCVWGACGGFPAEFVVTGHLRRAWCGVAVTGSSTRTLMLGLGRLKRSAMCIVWSSSRAPRARFPKSYSSSTRSCALRVISTASRSLWYKQANLAHLTWYDVFAARAQRNCCSRVGPYVFGVDDRLCGLVQTTLLLQLTTSLTLLAVSTTIVDVLATKLLPQRNEYKLAKYAVRTV